MKIVTLALFAAAMLLAQDKGTQERKAPPPASTPAAAALPTIPPDAKEIEPGLFRYTDAQGKTWLMRKTPFGVGKWEDKPAAAETVAPVSVPVTVTDLGDSYQFVRDTPFGPSKWTRKKSELNDDEKAIVKKQLDKSTDSNQSNRSKQPDNVREKP